MGHQQHLVVAEVGAALAVVDHDRRLGRERGRVVADGPHVLVAGDGPEVAAVRRDVTVYRVVGSQPVELVVRLTPVEAFGRVQVDGRTSFGDAHGLVPLR